MLYKNFTDMPVWQKAMDLSIAVFSLSSTLPRSEDYGLTSQLRRAANPPAGGQIFQKDLVVAQKKINAIFI